MRGFPVARLRRLEYFVVLLAVLFVVGAGLLSLFGGDALQRLAAIPAGTLLAMLALSLVNYGCRGLRWLLYTRCLGLAVAPGRNLIFYVAGFALTTTPGKLGEALRLWLIERCHGYRYERLAPLFLADRLSDMNGVLVICLVGALGFPAKAWLALAAGAGVLLLTVAFVFPRPLIRLMGALYDLGGRRGRRLFARIRTALRHTARLFRAPVYGASLVLSLVGWFAESLAFALLLGALGTGLSLLPAMFVFTVAMIAGAVSMLPGGLGSTEATMIALLLALRVDFDSALVATAVIRLTTLWFGVGIGSLALPFALKLARRPPAVPMAALAVRP
jgi:glycosyltransferase 2 family protein